MLISCNCQKCGEAYQFDNKDFIVTARRGEHVSGQTINCPHCGEPTVAYAKATTRPAIANVESDRSAFGGGLVLMILGALCILGAIVDLVYAGESQLLICGIIALMGVGFIVGGIFSTQKLRCRHCGNPISDRQVRQCPTCQSRL